MGTEHDGDASLIAKWIVCGNRSASPDEAKVVGAGVPIWALIGYLPAVNNDEHQVAKDYEIPIDAVRAAVAYYRRHRELIDARLSQNAQAFA